jgi:DNA-binding NarL/FixJ family response regulator
MSYHEIDFPREENTGFTVLSLAVPLSIGHVLKVRKNGIRLLQRLNPEIRAIILSVHDEQTVLDECLAAGAKGFVLKRTASTDLLGAVETVLRGATYISPSSCTQTEN